MAKDIKLYKGNSEIVINESNLEHFLTLGYKQEKETKQRWAKRDKLDEFKELISVVNDPQLAAKILLVYPNEIASHKKISREKVNNILNTDVLVFVLENLKKKKISESQVKEVLERIVEGENLNKAVKFQRVNFGDLEEKIMKIIKKKPGLSEKAYMGLVMKEFKGKIDGKVAMEMIGKFMK